jgi:hypothetical protein
MSFHHAGVLLLTLETCYTQLLAIPPYSPSTANAICLTAAGCSAFHDAGVLPPTLEACYI